MVRPPLLVPSVLAAVEGELGRLVGELDPLDALLLDHPRRNDEARVPPAEVQAVARVGQELLAVRAVRRKLADGFLRLTDRLTKRLRERGDLLGSRRVGLAVDQQNPETDDDDNDKRDCDFHQGTY